MKFKVIGILLMSIFALCGCEPGVIHANSDDTAVFGDAVYMPVAGVYEITEGTQQVIDGTGEETTDLTGYVFPVSQNTVIVSSLGCISYTKANGEAGCGGSESYSFDGWYGPIRATVSGKMQFFEDGTMEMKIQINGEYTEQNYSYTINYDLKAKLKDLGKEDS